MDTSVGDMRLKMFLSLKGIKNVVHGKCLILKVPHPNVTFVTSSNLHFQYLILILAIPMSNHVGELSRNKLVVSFKTR